MNREIVSSSKRCAGQSLDLIDSTPEEEGALEVAASPSDNARPGNGERDVPSPGARCDESAKALNVQRLCSNEVAVFEFEVGEVALDQRGVRLIRFEFECACKK
jgi:hypothetical protein